MSSIRPYYRPIRPGPFHVIGAYSDGSFVDLRYVRLPSYGEGYTVDEAVRRFDARTAEFVRASIGKVADVVSTGDNLTTTGLLEFVDYGIYADPVYEPTARCLAALAYGEYFPYDRARLPLARVASRTLLNANPGYCGSIGPDVTGAPSYASPPLGDNSVGDYDLTQMRLLPMAYRYADVLEPDAWELLVTVLLATGLIHRINKDDLVTSGRVPNDWSRAGYVSPLGDHINVGETENHILQIHTARYLTNQLLFARDQSPDHDNRRNGTDDAPTCTDLMLRLLRNFLRDDFSEYNAKPYTHETRSALLHLYSYAYDHSVRLAARMVLDYISAHVAVSSCDLRRLVPFRRRNEPERIRLFDGALMNVALLDWQLGADHSVEPYAVQAGNLRGFETVSDPARAPLTDDEKAQQLQPGQAPLVRTRPWTLIGGGEDGMLEGLSDYRLPPLIHDLFVNDAHRRCFQRLHRRAQADEESGQNTHDMEIYAVSPSYLISAGGEPTTYAISPDIPISPGVDIVPSKTDQELGVAVSTSFMPTGDVTGFGSQNYARDLVQFSGFAAKGFVTNYGAAPDFACGNGVSVPDWCRWDAQAGLFSFVNKESTSPDRPGFYLAFLRDGVFTVLEAYDTWFHFDDPQKLSFPAFCTSVFNNNANVRLSDRTETTYTMVNGNAVVFAIWADDGGRGAEVRRVDVRDEADPSRWVPEDGTFLRGAILQSVDEAVITIMNPALPATLTLDMRDFQHPRRTDEFGVVETAGANEEVWVDFDWQGAEEGDFFRPYKSLAAAVTAVADRGVIKIVPGSTRERPTLSNAKRYRLEAAIGGVTIGAP